MSDMVTTHELDALLDQLPAVEQQVREAVASYNAAAEQHKTLADQEAAWVADRRRRGVPTMKRDREAFRAEIRGEHDQAFKDAGQDLTDKRTVAEMLLAKIERASERPAPIWERTPVEQQHLPYALLARANEQAIYDSVRARFADAAPSVQLAAYETAIAQQDQIAMRFFEEHPHYAARERPTTSEIIALFRLTQRKREQAVKRHPAAAQACRVFLAGVPAVKAVVATRLRLLAKTAISAA